MAQSPCPQVKRTIHLPGLIVPSAWFKARILVNPSYLVTCRIRGFPIFLCEHHPKSIAISFIRESPGSFHFSFPAEYQHLLSTTTTGGLRFASLTGAEPGRARRGEAGRGASAARPRGVSHVSRCGGWLEIEEPLDDTIWLWVNTNGTISG